MWLLTVSKETIPSSQNPLSVSPKKQPPPKKNQFSPLYYIVSLPVQRAQQLCTVRDRWERSDSGWDWVPWHFLQIIFARLSPEKKAELPLLRVIGERLAATTSGFRVRSLGLALGSDGRLLQAPLEPSIPLQRFSGELQDHLIESKLLSKKAPPPSGVILARRVMDSVPSKAPISLDFKQIDWGGWKVAHLHLVETRHGSGPMGYSILESWPLKA